MTAPPAQLIYGADVFGRQDQRILTTYGSLQRSDVFARQERQATATMLAEPLRLPVRLLIEGGPIEFTYVSFDRVLPPWSHFALQSLAERWGTRPGWDSYRAQPTNPELVAYLLNILSNLMQPSYLPPQIMPLADGGVQAEWHSSAQDLEIVVTAEDPPTYYYFNRRTGAEENSELERNYAHVQDLVGQLTSQNA
jgi:hypothetical protein